MEKAKSRRPRMWRSIGAVLLTEAARPVIGGQAVIEGVMMRSPHSFAVAVRRPDGRIVVREEAWLSFSERLPILKWPLLRGATMLIESMYNGLGALNFSAEQAMIEEADDDNSAQASSDAEAEAEAEPKSNSAALWGTIALSMLLAMALFKGLPHVTTMGIGALLGGAETAFPVDGWRFHLVDGIIKIGIFVGYIGLISRLPDVRRLFCYHGAEHMSVHSYEQGAPLDVEHTAPQSTAHPRCGTTLILLVLTVSILVFMAFIPLLPRVSDTDWVQALFSLAVKVPMMLPVAGVAYEVQRYAARHPQQRWIQLFIAPGMLMQKLTTRRPENDQVEVALTALRKAVWREAQARQNEPVSAEEARVEVFRDFADVTLKVGATA